MDNLSVLLAWLAAGYLFGSFPTGYAAVKLLRGQDIRTLGSGNIGGTNVGRVMGKKWAVIVTAVDMLKGGAAVLLCRAFGGSSEAVALAAFGAVCGHNYPVWLRFCGGKGVATTFGTLFFVQMWHSCAGVLAAGALWLVIMKSTRYVSLASLAALCSMGVFFYFLRLPAAFVVLAFVLTALSAWRHRSNIARLLSGTENRVGQK
ncbi:MAG: glycerol-3-phosphate 1-O-acyltransferase PlsY [Pyramidobacter sp.]|nr:glycerol-3-phosphate 1-O-acyltransferase PlsY [Pyramidobacter sp.]